MSLGGVLPLSLYVYIYIYMYIYIEREIDRDRDRDRDRDKGSNPLYTTWQQNQFLNQKAKEKHQKLMKTVSKSKISIGTGVPG